MPEELSFGDKVLILKMTKVNGCCPKGNSPGKTSEVAIEELRSKQA